MRSKTTKFVLRAAAVVLAAACIVAVPSVSVPAHAETLQQKLDKNRSEQQKIKNKIAELKKQKADKQTIANQYKAQAESLQQRSDLCNNLIQQYSREVEKLDREIDAKNKEIEENKETFKKRLRAIQMSGDTANITLLLGADNLADFLSKAQIAKSVSAYDKKIINELIEARKKIEADEKVIKDKQEEQKKLFSELETALNEAEKLLAQAEQAVNAVSGDISEQDKLLKRQQQAESQLESEIARASGSGSYDHLIFTSINFAWPLNKKFHMITSPFGMRSDPFTGRGTMHKGTDISGPGINRQPIYASADGVVSLAKYNPGGYGNYVMISHGRASDGKTYTTLYGHMTSYSVYVGQSVKQGQQIGLVGSTGSSTGPHLHFEIRINNTPTNAMNYVTWR